MPTTTNTDRIRTDRQGNTWLDLPARGLRRGMVVRSHGMILLVEHDARRSQVHADTHGGCYYASCIILNPTDPEADDLAVRLADRDEDGVRHWSLQGNDLATWCVAAPTAPAYTWHPSRRPGVDSGTLLEAEQSLSGGCLVLSNAITLDEALRVYGKVTAYDTDVPVVVDVPAEVQA